MLYNIDINLLGEKYLSIKIELDLSKEDTLYLFVGIFRTLLFGIKEKSEKNNTTYVEELFEVFLDEEYITQYIKGSLDIADKILATSKKDIYSESEKDIYDITVTENSMPDTIEELFNN